MIRLAVVIVSYNTRGLLRDCLRSIGASTAHTADRLAVEVVVVDNASTDSSAVMVAEEFPSVHLIAADQNLGFTGGNNLALRFLGFLEAAQGASNASPAINKSPFTIHNSPLDYVLLLNPDAEVLDDALYTMAAFLHAQPQAGVCGARLQYADGRFQHGAFRFPTLGQVALDLFPPIGLPGAHHLLDSRLNGRYPMSRWEGETPFVVDFVLGAAMMMRGAAIRQIGGFDDGYWMYCEEMDWCLHLRDAGWKTYVVPTAQAIHHEGQSSRQTRWLSYVQLWRSRFRFYSMHAAHYPPGYPAVLRVLVRIGLAYRRRQADVAFARGVINGVELADELSAYAEIGRL